MSVPDSLQARERLAEIPEELRAWARNREHCHLDPTLLDEAAALVESQSLELQAKSKTIQDLELELVRAERRQTVYLDMWEQAKIGQAEADKRAEMGREHQREYARVVGNLEVAVEETEARFLNADRHHTEWFLEAHALSGRLTTAGNALRETETLLTNYLVSGKFPPGSDCEVVRDIVRAVLEGEGGPAAEEPAA